MADVDGRGTAPGARGRQAAGAPAARVATPGERAVQRALGTEAEAAQFYAEQVTGRLNERMRAFVARQEMFFLGTSDSSGACDCSFRAGPPGFLRAVDDRTVLYPEYRGNGVHASLGNVFENPQVALLLIDFERARIGLHINGTAQVLTDEQVRERHPEIPRDPLPGRTARLWMRIEVGEAYPHGAAHIPHLVTAARGTTREWGSRDYRRRGGDFFGVARERAAAAPSERSGFVRPSAEARAWRAEAARALAEAERRGRGDAPGGGWFGSG